MPRERDEALEGVAGIGAVEQPLSDHHESSETSTSYPTAVADFDSHRNSFTSEIDHDRDEVDVGTGLAST